MKLWRIERTDHWSHDEFDSAVVAAEDEAAARLIKPDGISWDSDYQNWCKTPDLVRVEYLGEAKPGTPAGVILASFNAG